MIRNPITDPGQYIVENLTVTITAYNVSVVPPRVFVKKLYANNSYMMPLTISFNESDIGALRVNITTYDDIHKLVYFNYTFIVVNATAYLDLHVINEYGESLPGAIVRIADRTYSTDSNGHVSLALPVGIYNYSIVYNGHIVSGKLAVHTGHNTYTIVVDSSPPAIVSVKQRGYGIFISAYDPGANCSGIHAIIFIQNGFNWTYQFYPQRNLSVILYPPLKTGTVKIVLKDSQGNAINATIEYIELHRGFSLIEAIMVISIVLIVSTSLAVLTMNRG